MSLHPLARAALVAVVSTGCATLGSSQRAETLGRGADQWSFEPGAFGLQGDGELMVLPTVNVAYRRGLSDRFDLGVRLGTTGIGLETKVMLTAPGSDDLVLSLAPSATYAKIGFRNEYEQWINLQAPVLIGQPLGRGQLVVGPRFEALFLTAMINGSTLEEKVAAYSVGTSLGYALPVGPRWQFLPEVTALYPLAGTYNGAVAGGGGGVLLAATLGFLR